jgi:hypothetical protein
MSPLDDRSSGSEFALPLPTEYHHYIPNVGPKHTPGANPVPHLTLSLQGWLGPGGAGEGSLKDSLQQGRR